MLKSVDHIVIAVRDLAESSADYAAAGFNVLPGGDHTHGTTHNALISFADGAYFELIAAKDPANPPAGFWWFELLEKGEGYVAYALLADDVAAEVERLRAAGLNAGDVRPGGRLRPDGRQVDWRTASLPWGADEPPTPFLIDDITDRSLRVPDGAATVHPLGVTGVAGVTVAVRDLDKTRAIYSTFLGSAGQPVESPHGNAVRFQLSAQWLELVSPTSGDSPLAAYLDVRGDTPYAITLRGGPAELLPLELTHGARLIAGAA